MKDKLSAHESKSIFRYQILTDLIKGIKKSVENWKINPNLI